MAKEKEKTKRMPWKWGIIVSLLLTILVMFFSRTGLLYDLELFTYDYRFQLRGPVSVDHSDAVVVIVDDESLATLPHKFPFPRSYHARLIRNLLASGARMIVFDIQFTEPDLPEEDAQLAEATALAPDKIIHCGKIAFYETRLGMTQASVVVPVDTIRKAGAGFAIVNDAPDPDGFSRQYILYMTHRDTNYVPLALKAYQFTLEKPDTVHLYRNKPGMVTFAGLDIPTQTENTMLINFYGPARTFPTYNYASILDDAEFNLLKDDTDFMQWFLMSDEEFSSLSAVLPEESVAVFREIRADNPFKDKIVFVGVAFTELQDTKKTPFYTYREPGTLGQRRETPGVEWHVHAFQTLVDRSFIRNVPPIYEWLIVFFLILGVFFLNNSTRMMIGSLTTVGLLLLVLSSSMLAFIHYRVWVAVIAPSIGIVSSYGVTTIYLFIKEQREKAMIRGMFSRYVPQKVVNELIQNPDLLKLGGERRRMTALFTDIAGFTSVSEKMSPDELVSLLNTYLSSMSTIILENEGIIDKYEGDLIMAEWGAPVFFEDHAARACRAALKMQEKLASMREEWRKEGAPVLYSRVGINTGEMIVGNMGCLEVFDYTVMGDAVNLASRLEGANKSYGTTIMIGPETAKDVEGIFVVRCLDDIRVKGKDKPVRVFELLAESNDSLSPRKQKAVAKYHEGLELYRNRHFNEAKMKFDEALKIEPSDSPSTTYLKRCEEYILNPPPPDWDGVFILTEK